jgi:hypothetical protein
MAGYTEAAAAARRAREARDAAREELYLLKLRGVALGRAEARASRGEGRRDPAVDAELKSLRKQLEAASDRRVAVDERLEELAPVKAEITRLSQRIEAAPAVSSALTQEISRLAAALDKAPARAREPLQESVRTTQSQRAALAEAIARDRDALAHAQELQKSADELLQESRALKTRTTKLRREIETTEARGRDVDLGAAVELNQTGIGEAKGKKTRADLDLRAAIDGLYVGATPGELLASWDDSLPITLLPLRIETRWKTDLPRGVPELWVRVYPDDVGITTHEPLLTPAEVEHGQGYWSAYRAATNDAGKDAAWKALAKRFGGNRAAWVARQSKPLNWDAALADPELSLDFPVLPIKPDAWTTAPHSRVLPDRFVLMAWHGEARRIFEVGAPVDDIVMLGPSPVDAPDDETAISREVLDNSLKFGEAFDWVRDFPKAVACGMAFRVPVTAADMALGFDKLLVLGLKLSADAPEAQSMLESLIDNHHYSNAGFELLRQGTPTNNTDGNDSGYTRGGETGVAGAGPVRFTGMDDRALATDGQRLADFLGIAYEPLLHADGAQLSDHREAVAMNRALYSGTLGYYLDQMLNDVVDDSARLALRRHFTDQVTGRGPIAAIRVGNQPFGILPTSSLARWQPHSKKVITDGPRAVGAIASADPFEAALLTGLRVFDAAWSSKLADVPQLGGGGSGRGSDDLLKVLGLHPTSAEFHQRVGYSFDYLRNLESFAFGGSDMDDVMKMFIEGMGARTVLRRLGYAAQRSDGTSKPLPTLLQLIWRHYQTTLDPRQLIDGLPLSEAATIKPYGTTTANYIDWLQANAADAAALEAQSFGGATRPSALLYMMLHFALVMESSRAIHQFLGAHEIKADELVRSRKFLNVTGTSPSVWEVMRAPANRIVAAADSPQPLLALMHTPQVGDAGQGIQELKAALDILRSLPTARLERGLVEHIDTLSYRLDAWQTSLFARRLQQQRGFDAPVAQRRTGAYLGAYGYLEKVRPAGGGRTPVPGENNLYKESANGGYVHAPSLNHATAAALLRSGYLTHASPSDPDALAVNLSSGRVQRARYLLEGIRNGQTLETLLGVQFERGLHDWTTLTQNPVILDQLKPVFRAQFPILRTRVPQTNNSTAGAAVVEEDYQVVNGLSLARTKTAFPYGIAELSALSAGQQDAIKAEKASIENTLDALRDVLTAESAYQLALGNFDRAAAVLQSAGSGTLPPDIEVLNTPRGTQISFTQRLSVQLNSALGVNPWSTISLTERARLDLSLNAWLGYLLGVPATICCRAQAVSAEGAVLTDGGGPIDDIITLEQLDLQPIDFVYLVRSQTDPTGAAELETRVRHVFAKARALSDDVIVRIAFSDAGSAAGVRSFAEVLPLADRLRKLLGTARPLDARHFQSASKDAPANPDNPGRIVTGELMTRVSARLAAVRDLFPDLQDAVDTARASSVPAEIDALRDALLAIARAGFSYAMPRSVTGSDPAQRDVLVDQADALLKRADTLGTATDTQLADAAAATNAEQLVSLLSTAVKSWMGSDMILLPRFAFGEVSAVSQADAARDALLTFARTAGAPLPVEEWLHGAACVRPLVHDFEMVRAMADATRPTPLPLAPLQLPFRAGDSWLGADFPPDLQVMHDTVSMVQHLPQGFAAAGPQCGLLIDEWNETVPMREEVTGLTFNYNAPNSAPPQAILLAVTPHETGSWNWDDLVDSVLDTFRRAKLRAVEPDTIGDIGGIGTLLPAVVAEFSTGAASVSLDYSMVLSEIRIPVLAMAAERE